MCSIRHRAGSIDRTGPGVGSRPIGPGGRPVRFHSGGSCEGFGHVDPGPIDARCRRASRPTGAMAGRSDGRARLGPAHPGRLGLVSDARAAGGAPGGRDRHAGPGRRAGDHLDRAGSGGRASQARPSRNRSSSTRAGFVAPVRGISPRCRRSPREPDGPARQSSAGHLLTGLGRVPAPVPSVRGLPGLRAGNRLFDLPDELGEQGLARAVAGLAQAGDGV